MKKIMKAILIVICLVLIIFLGLQWRSYQKLKSAYDEGILYFQEADYKKSGEIFEEASKVSSLFGRSMKLEMLGYQAEGCYNLGEYEEAASLYDSLIHKRSNNSIYYTMKGLSYEKLGNDEEAKKTFNQGWEKTKDTSFLQVLCKISIEEGNLDSALSYVNIGLKEKDADTQVFLFDKIVVYEKSQEYDKAYAVAKEYCEKYPEDEKGQKEYVFLSTRIQ